MKEKNRVSVMKFLGSIITTFLVVIIQPLIMEILYDKEIVSTFLMFLSTSMLLLFFFMVLYKPSKYEDLSVVVREEDHEYVNDNEHHPPNIEWTNYVLIHDITKDKIEWSLCKYLIIENDNYYCGLEDDMILNQPCKLSCMNTCSCFNRFKKTQDIDNIKKRVDNLEI